MPPRRLVEPKDTCEISVDGQTVKAVPGEPVAVALAAAGRTVLGRSVKYHRPRGAFCYASRCDGCLMRVDGVSSVMTCEVPAREGMVVETQNVVGSARHDLLAATDWFFPRGMDHHHMFTWSKPVNQMMQKVARRIAGIGRLPDETIAPIPHADRTVDVLVVGGGPTGLVAAAECARAGAAVLLVEEGPCLGGHLTYLPGEVEDERGHEVQASGLAARLAAEARAAGVEALVGRSAVAVYGPDDSLEGAGRRQEGLAPHTVAVLGDGALTLVHPHRLLVAAGASEAAVAIPGNDAPGVLGVRALARLLSFGVVPGDRIAFVGDGHWSRAVRGALEGHDVDVLGPFAAASVRRIAGRPEVRHVEVVDEDGHAVRHACDAVAITGPCTGAYELAGQAGVPATFSGEAFHLDASGEDGTTVAGWARAVGQCSGVWPLPEGIRQARAAGRALARERGDAGA